MIGRLNHIAIAVPNVEVASRQWETLLGASVSEPQELHDHGVRVIFISAPNCKVELIEPLGKTSPIESFLKRNKDGGIHHICYEVDDIKKAKKLLVNKGARVLGDGIIKKGAHGNPVLFLHPKEFNGTLIELEQITTTATHL